MIIDAIRDIKTVINVSHYDTVSNKIANGSLSFLENEPLVWTIADQHVTRASMVIDFATTIKFEDLLSSFAVAAKKRCYYSHDGYTWEEFQYFKYSITTPYQGEDYDIMNRYEGKIFKIEYIIPQNIIGGTTVVDRTDVPWYTTARTAKKQSKYSLFDPEHKAFDPIPLDDYTLLKKHLDAEFLDPVIGLVAHPTTPAGKIVPEYVFRIADLETSLDKCIYDNLLVSHIRIDVEFAITNIPQSLINLNVLASADINIEDTYLSIFTGKLFSQKYFEEFTFEPSIAASFFDMLEATTPEYAFNSNQNFNDITIDFILDTNNATMALEISPPLTLGSYFNPLYIWTISAPSFETKRFIYTSIQEAWPDVNARLPVILSSHNIMTIEFAIRTDHFTMKRSVTYTYTTDGWVATSWI